MYKPCGIETTSIPFTNAYESESFDDGAKVSSKLFPFTWTMNSFIKD
ncbi:hypothetical protein A2U01_0081714, partial [Trifolium medium]|nr:hypothetical protein [Trifolium medium]